MPSFSPLQYGSYLRQTETLMDVLAQSGKIRCVGSKTWRSPGYPGWSPL